MLTFFRHIRKSLLGSGQARKYLLYAIGEIALVVIGILIALQINNWNEKRNLDKVEHTYLQNLKVDLESLQANIEQQEKQELSIMNNCSRGLFFLGEDPPNADSLRNVLTFGFAGRRTFKANRSVFQDLTSSGNIGIISNLNLRNHILLLYQRVDYVETVIENGNLVWYDETLKSLIQKGTIDISNTAVIPTISQFPVTFEVPPLKNTSEKIAQFLSDEKTHYIVYNEVATVAKRASLHISQLKSLNEGIDNLINEISKELD